MSTMTTPEQQAEELLPCLFSRCSELSNRHISICPASYRPAVAAALGAKDEQVACDACDGSGQAISGPCGCNGRGVWGMLGSVRLALAAKDAEIERLKGIHRHADCTSHELGCYHGELSDQANRYLDEIAQLRSQLAVAQGMRAKAEWKLNHDHTNHKWVYADGTPVPIGKCIDERHDWNDEMWIAQAERDNK